MYCWHAPGDIRAMMVIAFHSYVELAILSWGWAMDGHGHGWTCMGSDGRLLRARLGRVVACWLAASDGSSWSERHSSGSVWKRRACIAIRMSHVHVKLHVCGLESTHVQSSGAIVGMRLHSACARV